MTKRSVLLHTFEGCEKKYDDREIQILCRFFNCKSHAEIELAAQRWESLFLTTFRLDDGSEVVVDRCELQDVSEIALLLASDNYIDFADLKQSLRLRHPEKRNGPRAKAILPSDALARFDEYEAKQDWGKVPSQLDVVERLRRMNILSSEVSAATWLKLIQHERRERSGDLDLLNDSSREE